MNAPRAARGPAAWSLVAAPLLVAEAEAVPEADEPDLDAPEVIEADDAPDAPDEAAVAPAAKKFVSVDWYPRELNGKRSDDW